MSLPRCLFLSVDPVVDTYWLVRQFSRRIEADRPGPMASGLKVFMWEQNRSRAKKAVRKIADFICYRKVALEMVEQGVVRQL